MSLELERAIANHADALRSLARAFADAANVVEGDNATIAVMQEITEGDVEPYLSPATIVDVMVALVGLLAAKLDQPPKQIWEQLWKDAPTDAWWHEKTKPTPRGETDE